MRYVLPKPKARTVACFVVTLLLLHAPRSIAQAKPNPMDASAEQIAGSISHAKLSKVIVFDFSGPDKKTTQLGHDFAAEFQEDAIVASHGIGIRATVRRP